ncbi:MAG: c-type cytochrome [Spongiibacteraceae bacterium]|jgi:cytochrome c oxidase cbb3-type subunit 3|nr:c-type cytochrome [Spongiibacteraceae bacterium]
MTRSLILAALLSSAAAVLAQPALDQRLLVASPTMIEADPALLERMVELAEPALAQHCSSCHGETLEGTHGIPNLVDHEWIWGVTGFEVTTVEPVHQIMQTILFGIRDTECPDDVKQYGACPDTRYSEMPAYSNLGFSDQQIDDLVDWVLDLAGWPADATAVTRAQEVAAICIECHGEDGTGFKPFGGPDLTDDIWLYGDSRDEIRDVIAHGRKGTCPAWFDRLDPVTIKSIAAYLFMRSQEML